jgi:dipeptidyl aminopeptidase/acylaminoacyl peptidase
VLDVAFPGAPAWSADGGFVAATVYEDDGRSLVVASPDDDADPWRVAPGGGPVTGFEWGPESRPSDLVVTTDDGETYLVDATDRDHRLVASTRDGESAHAWSGDGDRVAYYRDGRLAVRNLAAGAERELPVPERGPYLGEERMIAWDGDRIAYRFVDREAKQIGVVDVSTGDLVWRTSGTASSHTPAWLADGRLVFVRVADRGTVREVVAADPDTSDETVLLHRTDPERGVVGGCPPSVSPDDTRIGVTAPLDGWEHVHVVDPASGERRQVTRGEFEDRGVHGATPQWLGDDALVFASNRRDPGQRQVFAVPADGGDPVPLVETAGTNVHPRPSPDCRHLAYVHADREVSPELRVTALDPDRTGTDAGTADASAGPRRLTRSTVADWPVDPIAPEPVSFESHDGREIPGYLLDPRRTDAVADDAIDLPAVVWVHGGPMRQMRDGWHPSRSYGLAYTFHQYLATRGYVGLAVNYRGGIGYGREFRQAIADAYGRAEMRDVVAARDYLADRDYVDGDGIGLWGLSYGGYAALQLLGTHPDAFAVGVNLAGLADLESFVEWAEDTKYPPVESAQSVVLGGEPWEAPDEWAAASPITHVDAYEAPLYSFHGTDDRYVDFGQLDVVVEALLDADKAFDADRFPGESHVFSNRATWRHTLRKIEAAFDDHL